LKAFPIKVYLLLLSGERSLGRAWVPNPAIMAAKDSMRLATVQQLFSVHLG
jgi:hypothetical protein